MKKINSSKRLLSLISSTLVIGLVSSFALISSVKADVAKHKHKSSKHSDHASPSKTPVPEPTPTPAPTPLARPVPVSTPTIIPTPTPVSSDVASRISIDLVEVGDPDNTYDQTGHGSVPYTFYLGKTDVTVDQYCAFLNAVAAEDKYMLYAPRMGDGSEVKPMIIRTGTSPHFSYSVTNNMGNYPIIYVDYFSTQRFCNWLENGQPKGSQGPGTTETGSYTIGESSFYYATPLVSANEGASWRLPTRDEWYKAAYYKSGSQNAGYWTYPTQSDTAPGHDFTGANDANYGVWDNSKNGLTPVGSFINSPGPYGTYDMGGDVYEWTSYSIDTTRNIILYGGDWKYGWCWFDNSPAWRLSKYNFDNESPSCKADTIGFRVVGPPPQAEAEGISGTKESGPTESNTSME